MAEEPKRARYLIYDYTTNKTFTPRNGEIFYFSDVASFIKNTLSVVGDGTNQVQNLPFREIINIETSVDISLVPLRISGNILILQNTSTTGKNIDIGITGTPYYYNLQPHIAVMMKFNGTDWILVSDAVKSIFIDDNYVIPNNDYVYNYQVNTSSKKEIIVTLPLIAQNLGKEPFTIQNIRQGIVRIITQGSDTINGMTELRLYSLNNYVEIYPRTVEWAIRNQYVTLDSGRVNTSDWPTRSLGLANVNYDTVTAGAPVIGGVVSGGTSGATGKIVDFNSTTLFLSEVTAGGIFTNNEILSGVGFTFTALVNEPTGDNKNKDTNINIHQMGDKINQIIKQFIIYNSDDDINYVQPGELAFSQGPPVENYGYSYFYISADSIGLRTGAAGFAYINFAGNRVELTTQDVYYRHYFIIEY